MRFKINFLVFSNDEAEMTKMIMGYDADQPIPDHYDESGHKEKVTKTIIQNMIIQPSESIFFQIWDILINSLLFVGYFQNMIHIAF